MQPLSYKDLLWSRPVINSLCETNFEDIQLKHKKQHFIAHSHRKTLNKHVFKKIDMRGRKKGYDGKKIAAIVEVLFKNPDGIWLRKIAEETKMSPATVSRYLDTILNPLIETSSLGEGKPILRVIRLRPLAIEKIREGEDLGQIIKLLGLMKRV